MPNTSQKLWPFRRTDRLPANQIWETSQRGPRSNQRFSVLDEARRVFFCILSGHIEVYILVPIIPLKPNHLSCPQWIPREDRTVSFLIFMKNNIPIRWHLRRKIRRLFENGNMMSLATEISFQHVFHFSIVVQQKTFRLEKCLLLIINLSSGNASLPSL